MGIIFASNERKKTLKVFILKTWTWNQNPFQSCQLKKTAIDSTYQKLRDLSFIAGLEEQGDLDSILFLPILSLSLFLEQKTLQKKS